MTELLDGKVVYPLVRFGFGRSPGGARNLDSVAHRAEELRDPDVAVRRQAAKQLLKLRPTREAWEAGIVALKDPDVQVRCSAVALVLAAKFEARQTAIALMPGLEDSNTQVRRYARSALMQVGREAVPLLLAVAAHEEKPAQVRGDAAVALVGYVGSGNPQIVAAVRRALREAPPEPRAELMQRMFEYKVVSKEVVPELLANLQGKNKDLGCVAGLALASLGKQGKPAVPALVEALKGRRTRTWAATALQGIGIAEPRVVSALIASLHDKEDLYGRCAALDALAHFGPKAQAAVPSLIKALDDTRSEPQAPQRLVQSHAIWALGRMGPLAQPAVPRLLAIVKDGREPPDSRRWAFEALEAIDPMVGKKAAAFLPKPPTPPESGPLRSLLPAD